MTDFSISRAALLAERNRAEKAEARVEELERALRDCRDFFNGYYTPQAHRVRVHVADALAGSTPSVSTPRPEAPWRRQVQETLVELETAKARLEGESVRSIVAERAHDDVDGAIKTLESLLAVPTGSVGEEKNR